MKNKFAFILHPLRRSDILECYPILKLAPFLVKRYDFKDIARKLPVRKIINLKAEFSSTGKISSGMGIICPLFPEDFVRLEERVVLDKIKRACLLAQKEGAGIIGLGGFTSIVGNEGEVLAAEIESGITSGNAYTAYLALRGILKAAELMELVLSSATAAIVGATGDIGSICAKVLSKKTREIKLVARNEARLTTFAEEVRKYGTASVYIEKEIKRAVRDADIILTATSSLTTLIDPLVLKPGAIVCDVAIPPNIAQEVYQLRRDVFVFEGGKAKIPNAKAVKNKLWQKRFPDGIIFGCLAETMVLALEDYYRDFSIGRGNITEEKLDFIGDVSQKHGFQLAPFRCGNKILDEKQIISIKEKAKEGGLLIDERY